MIKIDGGKLLIEKFEKFAKSLQKGKIPFLLASDLRNMIEKRSLQGKGLKKKFEAYSSTPYWRSRKLRPVGKGGRPSKTARSIFYKGGYRDFAAATKGHTRPNLFASGQMFRAMQAMPVNDNEAKIIFTRDAEAKKAIINNQTREFWGANKKEQQILTNSFTAIVSKMVKEAKLQ
jgi:hypothetical protein